MLSALVYDVASFAQRRATRPGLTVLGELPAHAREFGVERIYQGPQGTYDESLLLLDPDEVVQWQQPWRHVRLRGEHQQDHFRTRIDAGVVQIDSPGEHQLVFLVNGVEIARTPVPIDAPSSARAAGVLGAAIEAALKRGSVLWVCIPQPDGTVATRPAWYVQDGHKVFVLTGPGEQDLPHLADAETVEVTVKSHEVMAAIGVVSTRVRVVTNGSEEFTSVATRGLGTRLNLPDGQAALARWTDTATMVELTMPR